MRHKMEKMRKMMGLPRLRVPTYAQLWDGTWWAKVGYPFNMLVIFHLTLSRRLRQKEEFLGWSSLRRDLHKPKRWLSGQGTLA